MWIVGVDSAKSVIYGRLKIEQPSAGFCHFPSERTREWFEQLLSETLVVAIGEFGRAPRLGVSTSGNSNGKDGRDHWPYCYTSLIAGAGVTRGAVYGSSDATGSAPKAETQKQRSSSAAIGTRDFMPHLGNWKMGQETGDKESIVDRGA